jgi:hypothetical protein
MVSLPSPDRYDLAVVGVSAVLLVVAYVIYPVQFLQIIVWLTIFTIYVGWMALALKRFVFDEEQTA